MLNGTQYPAGEGYSTVLADLDFETYSEAGYNFDEALNKWVPVNASPPYGLLAVGAAVYAEHPSTEVLCLYYDLKLGEGPQFWMPGMPNPQGLFDWALGGGLLEAHNSGFEYWIILKVCVEKYGWPIFPHEIFRCSMSKCAAFSLPLALGKAGAALSLSVQKDKRGVALIREYCMPKKPTSKDPRRRRPLAQSVRDAADMYSYCLGDIQSEAALSKAIPDLTPPELAIWSMDQRINVRGVHIDRESVDNMQLILDQAMVVGDQELADITGGAVTSITALPKMKAWLNTQGIGVIESMDAEHVAAMIADPNIQGVARRVIELRDQLGGSSVKKLSAIARRLPLDSRLHDLFQYHGAATGRFAGRGPQPHNLPAKGPGVKRCDPHCGCGRHYARTRDTCPWCGIGEQWASADEWGPDAVDDAFQCINTGRLDVVAAIGDPMSILQGCLRGLFSAAPGHNLMCSDFSAIEAVVLAVLAGEQWRIDLFNEGGDAYSVSAADITGIPYVPGVPHEFRKKVGKIFELACGFQGSVGACKAFGAEEHFEDDAAILAAVRKWRKKNANIVNFWYRTQDAVIEAIHSPGRLFYSNEIAYGVHNDILYCRLPSGRFLHYHHPRYEQVIKFGKSQMGITFWGDNKDSSKGRIGWIKFDTYGGKLVENITQAVARDLLTHSMLALEAAGYPIVLHVHDEIVAEVPEGFGSIDEFERIMDGKPDWATHYPVSCAGGWVGKRYRKG